MDTFATRLKFSLDRAGFPPKGKGRQILLSKVFNVTQQCVQRWLTGEGYPDTKRIPDVARELGVNLEWLLSGYGSYHLPCDTLNFPSEHSPRWKKIPIFSLKEAEKWEETSVRFILRKATSVQGVWAEVQASPDAYAIRMEGDSMVPRYMPGSIIILDPHYIPDPGHIVAYYIERLDKLFLGRLVKNIDGIELHPDNKNYKPAIVQKKDKYCGSIRQARMILEQKKRKSRS